jgi:hypothetical protein
MSTLHEHAELGLDIALEPARVSVAALQEAVRSVVSDTDLHSSTRAMQQAARAAGGHQRRRHRRSSSGVEH